MTVTQSLVRAPSARVKPDWDQVHREPQGHKGVTLLLLLDEYQETVQERGYSYSRLCKHYAAYAKHLKPSYRTTYTPGDRLFIDYSGRSVPIRDPRTGEAAQDAQIFVAVLGVFELSLCRSNVESGVVLLDRFPCPLLRVPGRQSRPLGPGHPQKLHHYPDLYEPLVNETYRKMAEHYSVAILPAHVKRPKDKSSVEQAVQLVTRWILAELRKWIFCNLASLNQAIRLLLDDINRRPFKGSLSGSGQVLFLGKEKAALSPLPSTCYEVACWKKAKAPIDYHVEIDSHL